MCIAFLDGMMCLLASPEAAEMGMFRHFHPATSMGMHQIEAYPEQMPPYPRSSPGAEGRPKKRREKKRQEVSQYITCHLACSFSPRILRLEAQPEVHRDPTHPWAMTKATAERADGGVVLERWLQRTPCL